MAQKTSKGLIQLLRLLHTNTPQALQAALPIANGLLRDDPKNTHVMARKSYLVAQDWRCGYDTKEFSADCRNHVGKRNGLDGAIAWAERAIDMDPASPYGYWALGYGLKYKRDYGGSANAYAIALSKAPAAFTDITASRRHLIIEWVESQIYWDNGGLANFLPVFDEYQKLQKRDLWVNWVKSFLLHQLRRYKDAIAALPDLPEDGDVHLMLAASYARLGKSSEKQRILHRDRFRAKPGRENWTAKDERDRDAFLVTKGGNPARDHWTESCRLALA
jgi:tetratricopeptide (TPR) repeat protein